MKTQDKLNMKENEVKVFENEQFGQIRTSGTAEQPLFCLVDVCNALDIKNASDCKSRLNPKGVVLTDTLTNGGIQSMVFIDEPNMYKCIFQSRKADAEKFQDWVTSEVLPSIRKTGGYIATSEDMTDEEIMAKALIVAQTTIEKRNERIKQLENKVRLDSPKVGYFDALIDRGLNVCFRDAAKEIGVKQKNFISYLLENKYIYRNKAGKLRPHADYDNDLFVVKDTKSDSNGWAGVQTLITPKGKETFRVLLNA